MVEFGPDYATAVGKAIDLVVELYGPWIAGGAAVYYSIYIGVKLSCLSSNVDVKEYRKRIGTAAIPQDKRETVEGLMAELQRYKPNSRNAHTIRRVIDGLIENSSQR